MDSIVGYKRENLEKIKDNYNLDIQIKQNPKYNLKKIDIKMTKTYKEFADDDETVAKRK